MNRTEKRGSSGNFLHPGGRIRAALKGRANAPQGLTHSLDSTKEGLPMNGTRNPIPTEAAELAAKVTEFWSLVHKRSHGQCWPWSGYEEDGYGRFYFEGAMRGAHELAVTFTTGERRAPELDTCHSCNNPICCNPAHLRFDTRAGNVADMIAAGTHHRPKGKLDRETVRVIRERYACGAKQIHLAADYGVTNGLISQIVRGLRWVNAPGPITTKRERYNHGE